MPEPAPIERPGSTFIDQNAHAPGSTITLWIDGKPTFCTVVNDIQLEPAWRYHCRRSPKPHESSRLTHHAIKQLKAQRRRRWRALASHRYNVSMDWAVGDDHGPTFSATPA